MVDKKDKDKRKEEKRKLKSERKMAKKEKKERASMKSENKKKLKEEKKALKVQKSKAKKKKKDRGSVDSSSVKKGFFRRLFAFLMFVVSICVVLSSLLLVGLSSYNLFVVKTGVNVNYMYIVASLGLGFLLSGFLLLFKRKVGFYLFTILTIVTWYFLYFGLGRGNTLISNIGLLWPVVLLIFMFPNWRDYR